MRISAEFVTSAAGPAGFPTDGLPEVALVGRSNVGKSSVINALVRQRVARTSGAPGKTRLANIYRVARESRGSLYVVDLPGYGYARGGEDSAREFEELTRAYFGQHGPEGRERLRPREPGGASLRQGFGEVSPEFEERRRRAPAPARKRKTALLLVDARHPGLESDRQACQWLRRVTDSVAIVATKIDKLARGQRIRAMRELESVFEDSVLPVSAVTGEGLDELWKLIDTLASSRKPQPRSSPNIPPKAMAPRRPRK